MGMLDDFIVNAKSAASAVGKQASKFADVSKLRINAADLKNDISKHFEALGRVVYDAKKTGGDSAQAVSDAVASIDSLQEQLDAVNSQIASANAKTICSHCGQENSKDAVFCSKCGYKLMEDDSSADDSQGGSSNTGNSAEK